MLIEEKGCVYFFKHIGLNPIKIGFSSNVSPIGRFDQFKTFAPFGAELIGFIPSIEPKELECFFHNKYSTFRLSGEWFDIKVEDAKREISFYSDIEDIKEKNEFEILWAKRKNKSTLDEDVLPDKIYQFFESNVELEKPIYYFDFFSDFKKLLGNDFPEITTIKPLTKFLKEYCKILSFKHQSRTSNGRRYHFIFKEKNLQ